MQGPMNIVEVSNVILLKDILHMNLKKFWILCGFAWIDSVASVSDYWLSPPFYCLGLYKCSLSSTSTALDTDSGEPLNCKVEQRSK